MTFGYIDAAALAFGTRVFTASEFARRTGTTRAAKVLSDLKRRGWVERVGRGRYRVLRPDERPDIRAAEWERIRSIVLSAPIPKAWTGPTAVEVWTGGRFKTAPSPFFREFFVAVLERDLNAWRAYLAARGVPSEGRKRVGAVVRLVPRPDLEAVELDGEPVVPRREVERFIKSRPATYEGVEELLARLQ